MTINASTQVSLTRQWLEITAWLLVLCLPWFLFNYMTPTLVEPQALFLALVSGAVVMWVFRLVPDFVPGLLLIVLVSLFDIAPHSVAFSGFVSEIFFLVFGVFVLAALLAQSSWVSRLERQVAGQQGSVARQFFTLAGVGFVLTLVVPSPLGRATMLQPLLDRFMDQRADKNSLRMLAHVHGSTLLSTVFLTGNPLNFLLLAALNQQVQGRFHWLGWAMASALVMFVICFGFMCSLLLLSRRSQQKESLQKATSIGKTRAPVALKDWGVLALYGVFISAVLSQSWHQIPLAWLVVVLALAVFALNGLTVTSLRTQVDWPTLLFIATVVAWGGIIDHLALTPWFGAKISFLAPVFHQNLYAGFAALMVTTLLIRLVVPGAPAFILLTATLLPLADGLAISPWVIGFTVLTVSEAFILPYQHGVYSQAHSRAIGQSWPIQDSTVLAFNLFILLLKCAALFASIPLWRAMNLM